MAKERRTYADRAEYMKKAVIKRRKRLKQLAIQYKGGKCEICGYLRDPNALEFHHKDPRQKDFALSSRGLTRSWERVKLELEKCILLCANCHREVHSGIVQLPDENQECKSGELRET